MQIEKHIKAIGITLMILGTIPLIAILRMFFLIAINEGIGEIYPLLIIEIVILLSFPVLFMIFLIFSGIGILKHKNWARIVAIIVSVFCILNILLAPVGIWMLIILTNKETQKLFKKVNELKVSSSEDMRIDNERLQE